MSELNDGFVEGGPSPSSGYRPERRQKLGILVLIMGTFSGCLAPRDERIVLVTRTEFSVYWMELERRWPLFFEGQCVIPPELPTPEEVFHAVTFIEVTASSRFPTCTYRPRAQEIRIGDDKWGSGCVPHELGHAVCALLNTEVCRDFEHPEYRSKC